MANKVGLLNTFGYWGLQGPASGPGQGYSDPNSWGAAQAHAAWNAWSGAFVGADYVGGLTVFADIESGFGGWSSNTANNQQTLNGFLLTLYEITPSGVFHEQAKQVVMMGGINQSGKFHDVWLWNGATWSEASSMDASPSGSIEGIAYDETRQVVLAYVVTGNKPDLGDKHHPNPIHLLPVTLASETWTWG